MSNNDDDENNYILEDKDQSSIDKNYEEFLDYESSEKITN